MTEAPSRGIRLYGTDEPVTPPRVLRAGALSAEFEAGNLRYIRFGGVEMIRAVSYIVRDKNWGTYNPTLSDLKIEENADGFRVGYSAVASDDAQEFAYSAEIVGRPDGTLRFAARGRAVTDFLTNRTGFVVLHPIENVSGQPARVTEATGKTIDTQFPDLIDPKQPMMNLRAITPRVRARRPCRMPDGGRHVRDGRPAQLDRRLLQDLCPPARAALALYARDGAELEQSVTLTVSGPAPAVGSGDRRGPPAHRRSFGRGPRARARPRSRRRGGRARARLGPTRGGRLASRLPLRPAPRP